MTARGSIRVYLCNGGGLLSESVDFARLGRVAAALPDVCGVEELSEACLELDGDLSRRIASGEAAGIVVVGCQEEKLTQRLRSLVAGVSPEREVPWVTADLKWSCHDRTGAGVASSHAESILRQAVARAATTLAPRAEPTATEAGVIVFGEGHAALRTTAEVSRAGFPVTVVTAAPTIGRQSFDGSRTSDERALLDDLIFAALEDHAVEVLAETTLAGCTTVGGVFEARLRRRTGQVFLRRAGAIVVATEPEIDERFAEYGLPRDDPRVMSQTAAEDAFAAAVRRTRPLPARLASLDGRRVVIAVGAREETSVVATERALRLALQFLERGANVCLLTRNLKVAGEGVERLAQQCRSRGVVIHKIDRNGALDLALAGDGVRCSFVSEALHAEVVVDASLVVLDERLRPSPELCRLAKELRLTTGPGGFVQPENVLVASVQTNHRAVLAVGPARGRFDVVSSLDDAAAAAMEIRRALAHVTEPALVKAEVDTAACCACLTCLRTCPHGAIVFDGRPSIVARYCEGCGQCAAECPMDAITMVRCRDERIDGEVSAAFDPACAFDPSPRFVVFGCERSTSEARRLAVEFGEALPSGMVFVELPCAGRIDELTVLGAFEAGADGVAVIGCTEGNCHSLHGNELAAERVSRLGRRLAAIGLEPERLKYGTVMSNTRVELAELLRGFAATLHALGPSPIRRPPQDHEPAIAPAGAK